MILNSKLDQLKIGDVLKLCENYNGFSSGSLHRIIGIIEDSNIVRLISLEGDGIESAWYLGIEPIWLHIPTKTEPFTDEEMKDIFV